MNCMRNTNKTCSSRVITPDWEEYPACMNDRECSYIPERYLISGQNADNIS